MHSPSGTPDIEANNRIKASCKPCAERPNHPYGRIQSSVVEQPTTSSTNLSVPATVDIYIMHLIAPILIARSALRLDLKPT